MTPTIVVLAAGMGKRYGGLKQFEAVGPGGATIMDYSLSDAARAGFGRVVVVIRRHMEQAFRERAVATFGRKMDVRFVFQEIDSLPGGFAAPDGRSKPWGTGHAILTAAPEVEGPFAVINADDFYGGATIRTMASFCARAQTAGPLTAAIAGYVLRNTLSDVGKVARGVCRWDARGMLEGIDERTNIERDGTGARSVDEKGAAYALTGDEIVSMNLWSFPHGIFDHLQRLFREFLQKRGDDVSAEFYIPSAVDALIRAGLLRVEVLKTADRWFGMTYREEHDVVVERIRRLVADGAYPENLWA